MQTFTPCERVQVLYRHDARYYAVIVDGIEVNGMRYCEQVEAIAATVQAELSAEAIGAQGDIEEDYAAVLNELRGNPAALFTAIEATAEERGMRWISAIIVHLLRSGWSLGSGSLSESEEAAYQACGKEFLTAGSATAHWLANAAPETIVTALRCIGEQRRMDTGFDARYDAEPRSAEGM